ncbi:MAG: VIT1/CCC1 transporter family protein [Armatimonas sp.]
MPVTPHVEKHFTSTETVRDIVIGMSDGLTVPFALAAGLTGAIAASSVVVTAGLAEVAAGCIAMGLGGYLAARGDAEHYQSELAREHQEILDVPEKEAEEVFEVLEGFGLTHEESLPIVARLKERPEDWVRFMMRFELGLEEPHPNRMYISAITIGGSYLVGGMVPLLPYFFFSRAQSALSWSVGITACALVVFGAVKGKATGTSSMRSAVQTLLVGGVAAAVAFAVARLFGHSS